MSIWYYISVYVHVICAAFWIGGMLFLPLVVLPGIKKSPDRIAILYKTGITFRYYGWIALITLLITGLLNMYLRGLPFTWDFFEKSNYGNLVCYKILFFITIIAVSGIHDFFIGNKALEEMQKNPNPKLKYVARWSGRINLLLALVMAFLGIILSRGGNF
ncbi:MAG: CopD family protein [Bacteroidia bacterium]